MGEVSREFLEIRLSALKKELGAIIDEMENHIGGDEAEFFHRGDAVRQEIREVTEHLQVLKNSEK